MPLGARKDWDGCQRRRAFHRCLRLLRPCAHRCRRRLGAVAAAPAGGADGRGTAGPSPSGRLRMTQNRRAGAVRIEGRGGVGGGGWGFTRRE